MDISIVPTKIYSRLILSGTFLVVLFACIDRIFPFLHP